MPIYMDGQEYQDGVHFEMATNPFIPQELKDAWQDGKIEEGNIDLTKRPVVKNDDGSISTVRSMSIGTDRGEVLIPTVAADGSRILSKDEAIKQYDETGQHLGIFATSDFATKYADKLHKDQEAMYASRMPLGSSEKPADASKTKSGTTLPDPKIDAVRAPYGVMADIEIPEGSAQGAVLRERIDSTAKSMFEAFTLPGKVYLGEVDPSTPEARGRAFELGSAMVFGPSTFAGKMVDGTLGSFAGVKSKTFDKNNLALAQIMESDGKHVDAIFAKTGMFRGVDGRWRYEISDTAATINQEALKYHPEVPPMQKVENIFEQRPFTEADYFAGSSSAKLSDFYDHPELYKAYPQLKKIDVVEDLNYKGVAEADSNGIIRYNPEGVKASGWTLKEILTHEIQHLIQNIEGFAKGGAPMKILNEGNDPYRLAFQINPDALSKIRKAIQGFVNKGRQGQLSDDELDKLVYFNKVLETHEKYISEANKQAMETYVRLAGETEARNVGARSSMDPALAKTLHPEWTQDVASQNQIVTQDPVFTTAYGTLRHTQDEYTKVPPAQLNSGGGGIQYNLLGYLFGEKKNEPVDLSKTKETGFPTDADAENAKKYEFGYGTGLEPYINNEVARIYDNLPRSQELDKVLMGITTNQDLTKDDLLRERVGNFFARSALAANRSAIASLGFDPSKMNLQVKMGKTNLAGFFDPKKDKIWINALEENTSTAVHESVHRGLQLLRNQSPEAKEILKGLPEELLVRYVMFKTMGDPEKDKGSISDEQRGDALLLFDKKHKLSEENRNKLERLEAIAADLFAQKRPGGPR